MDKQETEKIKTCWDLFGIECGKGWYELLKPLFEYIENYNKNKKDDEKIIIKQVKEKFGTLRFYTSFETDELSELISNAEDESSKTCELCGSKEHVGHTFGWITTCCEECAKKMAKNKIVRWKPNDSKDVNFIEFSPYGNVEIVKK